MRPLANKEINLGPHSDLRGGVVVVVVEGLLVLYLSEGVMF